MNKIRAIAAVCVFAVLSPSSGVGNSTASSGAGASAPIQPTFFGMHINRLSTPWPNIPFGSLRMLGNLTTWFHIEGAARNRYDWRMLDAWLNAAREHKVDVMYTFSRTPAWAARNPHSTCGPSRDEADCSPPTDLSVSAACQGPLKGTSTTDCYFKEFVTSLLDHVCSGKAPDKNCRIVAFSCWNEPNLDGFWIGTYAESAMMCFDMVQAVKAQCEKCITLTPDISAATTGDTKENGDARGYDEWFKSFLAAYRQYGVYPDAAAVHLYAARTHGIVPAPFPETFAGSGCPRQERSPACPDTVLGKIATVRSIMNQSGMGARPVWTTEGGWGTNSEMPDPDAQAAYIARWLILQASAGVQRAYWYMWDMGNDPQAWGGLWDARHGTYKAGTAYGQVFYWLTGAAFSKPCAADHDLWTCDLIVPDGGQRRIVWNDSRSYDAGATWKYSPNAEFKFVRDLDGHETVIANNQVTIGTKPVLLETSSGK